MEDDVPSRTNLNLFYTLDAILNTASLSEAARRISLTQPAISMALKRARTHFQDELIVEIAGERRFTELAHALRPRIRAALREAQQIMDISIDFEPLTASRTIRLTMPDFVEVLFLPHLLRSVRRAAPGIDLEVLPFDYWSASRQFEKEIDFAILPGPLISPDFGYRSLYTEELGVMLDTDNPLAIEGIVQPERYLTSAHAALFDEMDLLAPTHGPVAELMSQRKVVVRTANYAALPRLVLGTDLVVTTSVRYGQYCASLMGLTCLSFPVAGAAVEIALQWHPARQREPIVDWFADLLATTASISI